METGRLPSENGPNLGQYINLVELLSRSKRAVAKYQSVTDVPEEIEVGEDVTTDKNGRTPSTPLRKYTIPILLLLFFLDHSLMSL